jgi:hypothetical protein
MILTTEPITQPYQREPCLQACKRAFAIEAEEAGLINAIVDEEKLLDEAVGLGCHRSKLNRPRMVEMTQPPESA